MDNIIKAEDYQGTSIYDALISSGRSEEIIRETIANNLRKGLITHDQFNKANAQLDDLIKASKKTGAGSRGGRVIGYTKSGKPIYMAKQPAHKDHSKWSAQDHLDAADAHRQAHQAHSDVYYSTRGFRHGARAAESAKTFADHHASTAQAHEKHAHEQLAKEHESGLSADEKKIIAAQKKKQIEHHMKHRDMHADIARYINDKFGSEAHEVYRYHSDQAAHHHRQVDSLDDSPKNPHDK